MFVTMYRTLCKDGGGSVYTIIQWKSGASVLQGCKLATGTVEEEVQTVH